MGLGAILPQPQALSSAHLSLPAGTAAGSVAPLLLLSLATFLSPMAPITAQCSEHSGGTRNDKQAAASRLAAANILSNLPSQLYFIPFLHAGCHFEWKTNLRTGSSVQVLSWQLPG